MIKVLPSIYPDESFHSYLCRLFSHIGFTNYSDLAKEIFKRPAEYISYNFVNILSEQFKKELEKYISLEDIVLNHTLAKFYLRFQPKEKRRDLFQRLVANEESSYKLLPIPLRRDNYYLRYCPGCIREDRNKYGEAYFHISHQIPNICCCTKHGCELINTTIKNTQGIDTTLIPLELVIDSLKEIPTDKKTLAIERYAVEVFKSPIDLEDETPIGDYLEIKLNNKYFSPRGEKKNSSQLFKDLKDFYSDYRGFDITLARLKTIYKNVFFNAFDIILIAKFEKIQPNVLCKAKPSFKKRYELFDEEVCRLRKSGMKCIQIAKVLKVNKEIVRKILLGKYGKGHFKS